jgi:hypothetical protein
VRFRVFHIPNQKRKRASNLLETCCQLVGKVWIPTDNIAWSTVLSCKPVLGKMQQRDNQVHHTLTHTLIVIPVVKTPCGYMALHWLETT